MVCLCHLIMALTRFPIHLTINQHITDVGDGSGGFWVMESSFAWWETHRIVRYTSAIAFPIQHCLTELVVASSLFPITNATHHAPLSPNQQVPTLNCLINREPPRTNGDLAVKAVKNEGGTQQGVGREQWGGLEGSCWEWKGTWQSAAEIVGGADGPHTATWGCRPSLPLPEDKTGGWTFCSFVGDRNMATLCVLPRWGLHYDFTGLYSKITNFTAPRYRTWGNKV